MNQFCDHGIDLVRCQLCDGTGQILFRQWRIRNHGADHHQHGHQRQEDKKGRAGGIGTDIFLTHFPAEIHAYLDQFPHY